MFGKKDAVTVVVTAASTAIISIMPVTVQEKYLWFWLL